MSKKPSTQIIDLIDKSSMAPINKAWAKGLVIRSEEAEEKGRADKELIQEIGKEKESFTIIVSTPEVKIYALKPNSQKPKEDWINAYPFRSIFKNKNDKWERASTVSRNLEEAFLIYLEKRFIGDNSQFSSFAMKMLGMEEPK